MRIKTTILSITYPKISRWILTLCLLLSISNLFSQTISAPNNIFVRPFKKNAIFYTKSSVGFLLKLTSNSAERQRGTIAIEIKNAVNGVVFHDNISIYINSKSSYNKDLNYGKLGLLSGIYTLYVNVTTNAGISLNHFSFIVDPDNAAIKSYRPADFGTFWEEAKKELAAVNSNFQLKKRSDLSTSHADVYTLEFQSLDNITVRGYLTTPNKKGLFPVMCMFPDYVTEMKPEFMYNTAVLTLNVRGIGTSRDKIKADFTQYMNMDASNKKKFIYRGVYMDCYRSIDFLFKNGNGLGIDTSKILLKGTGQGAGLCAVTAVLYPKIRGIILERPLFLDVRDMMANAELNKPANWPASNMLDYCNGKISAITRENYLKTWDYFDPVNFAPYIGCPILYGFAYRSTMTPSICHLSFLGQTRVESKDILMCTECENEMDNKFYGFQGTWLNEVLNIP